MSIKCDVADIGALIKQLSGYKLRALSEAHATLEDRFKRRMQDEG